MTQEEHEKNKLRSTPLVNGLAIGAVLGAAAVLLTDKKNQKKVKHVVTSAKKWADEKTKEFSAKKDNTIDEIASDQEEENTGSDVHTHVN